MKLLTNKIIFIAAVAVLVFSPKFCSAAMPPWPDMIGESYGQILDVAYDQIIGALMGAAKQAAAQAVSKSVQSAVSSGGSSNEESASTRFISNWNEFLYTYPEKNAKLLMNDFFSDMFQGKGSSSNYKSSGGSSVSRSYIGQLEQNAKQKIGLESSPTKTCEIADSSALFRDGSWTAYNSLYSNNACNQFGSTLAAQSYYSNTTYQLTEEAKTKAISYQGFKPTMSGGSVVTPGSITKDILSSAEDLPNKIMAGSTKLPEIIVSLATRLATSAIKQGIGSAKAQISKNISTQTSNMQNITNRNFGSNPLKNFKPKF